MAGNINVQVSSDLPMMSPQIDFRSQIQTYLRYFVVFGRLFDPQGAILNPKL